MAVVRLEMTRREPVLDGAAVRPGGRPTLREDRGRAPLRAWIRRARANEADRGPRRWPPATRAGSWSTPPTSISCGRVDGGRPPAAPRRAQSRAQDRARHVQQRAALERPGDPRGLRQRLPDAPRLHGGLGRLAARRAAPRRHDGAHGAPGARRVRARALRVPAERAGRRAAAGRPLPHPASGRAPRRPGGGAARARARRRARGHGAARGAWRFPDAGSVALDGGFEPGRIYELLLPRREPAGGRARLHRGARHRGLPALGHRRRRGIPARGPSSGRTCSASRRAGASCATCSTWGSTRTRRAASSGTR